MRLCVGHFGRDQFAEDARREGESDAADRPSALQVSQQVAEEEPEKEASERRSSDASEAGPRKKRRKTT